MSLQVQSSQQPSSGRRTPQIYQNLGSTDSPATPVLSTNGNSGGSAKASSKLSLKASSGGKQSPVPELNAAVQDSKESPKMSNVVVGVTKLDKTPTSSPKTDKEKEEKDKATTNGETNGTTHSEKETNGKHEEPVAVPPKPETPKPEPVVEKEKKVKESPSRASPRTTPQKQQQPDSIPVEQVKTPESAGKKTPPVVTPERKKKADHSLAAEKPLKGFNAEGEEMESLVVEPSEYEDSPMPPRTGGKTKLLKYSGVPPTRARISPFRVHQEAATNASTLVNLSTVSEGAQSSESKESSPSLDFNRPLRAISGRRGTRPISDIQFTYRRSSERLNDSTSSLNVTIGSEIHNDSLRTPAPGSARKRKLMTPESTSDALDVKEVMDSPKRTRLDFSGFLGMVASPVTMLKNRLSRVRLQSSTPVAKRSFDDEDPSKCVQAEATTTTANISGEGANMDVDTAEVADAATPEEGKKADEAEKSGKPEQPSTEEGQTDLPSSEKEGVTADDGSGDGSEPLVEEKDVASKPRSYCVVM